jgi:hypothetical protein
MPIKKSNTKKSSKKTAPAKKAASAKKAAPAKKAAATRKPAAKTGKTAKSAKVTATRKPAAKTVKSAKTIKSAKTVKSAKSAKTATKSPNKGLSSPRLPALPPTNPMKPNPFAANPGGRHFAELQPVSDGPWTTNDSEQFFNSAYYNKNAVTAIPALREGASEVVNLSDIIGSQLVQQIQANGKIVFHAVGDTGAMTLTQWNEDEVSVADMMAKDLNNPVAADNVSFFFHLGDVIYQFGDDATMYYEQFYEPYRTYNAPIFAIPGNHDGMTHLKNEKPLIPYLDNFCAATPATSPDAQGLIRDTMTQPGVYFTLDAPFVSIIGLYSNILDGYPGGIISNYQGKYPAISNVQLTYLTEQLQRIDQLRKNGQPTAIVVATHHPPYAGLSSKGGSPMMLEDLDNVFTQTGIWPDAVLSGHTHHYERWTRNVNGKEIPYIIAGCGGYNMRPISPAPPTDITSTVAENTHELRMYLPIYGYLKISVNEQEIGLAYNSTNPSFGLGCDTVVVDLQTNKIIKEGTGEPDNLI